MYARLPWLMVIDSRSVLDVERSIDCVGAVLACGWLAVRCSTTRVQGRTCKMNFEQAGGFGRVLPVENRRASGQFKNSCNESTAHWSHIWMVQPCITRVTRCTRCDIRVLAHCKSSFMLYLVASWKVGLDVGICLDIWIYSLLPSWMLIYKSILLGLSTDADVWACLWIIFCIGYTKIYQWELNGVNP